MKDNKPNNKDEQPKKTQGAEKSAQKENAQNPVASTQSQTKKKVAKKAAQKRVKDKAPQTSASNTPSPQAASPAVSKQSIKAPEKPIKSGRGLAWLALLCSLLALAAGGYAAYQSNLNQAINGSSASGFDDRIKGVVSNHQGLQSKVDNLSQNNDQLSQTLTAEVKQLDSRLSTAQTAIGGLQKQADASTDEIKAELGESVKRWRQDELHSLLMRVSQNYQYTGDKNLALSGLNMAQQSLESMANADLAEVKTALADDVLRLKADVAVDISALDARLNSLSKLFDGLAFKGDAEKTTQTSASPAPQVEAASSTPMVQEDPSKLGSRFFSMGKTLLGDIGNLVKHKKLDAAPVLSLDESSKLVLVESLKLKLQASQLAMMRRDNDIYQSQLGRVEADLLKHFKVKQKNAEVALAELESLKAENVGLALENLNRGLKALQNIIRSEQ